MPIKFKKPNTVFLWLAVGYNLAMIVDAAMEEKWARMTLSIVASIGFGYLVYRAEQERRARNS
ncbi:hypothetical protein ACFSQ3_02630 [Sphingobacterium corticis]|uniref:Uncharacterized protein n=1 Tax=Sphingobacterium corticis TaxID=1812823 RepID=A0ABW5NIX7_9SPHI